MDPSQPTPPQPGGQFNPGQYDFITNPVPQPKKTLLPTTGSSKLQRILIVTVIVVFLLILISVGYSILTGGSKSNTEQLTTVLQQQTEMVRVTELATSKLGGEPAQSINAKTHSTMISQSSQLKSAIASRKIKVSTKSITAGKNAKTDQDLAAAAKNGRYDEAFVQTIRNSLEEYKKSLKSAYNGSDSTGIKEILNNDYSQVNLLLESITGQPQTWGLIFVTNS